MERKWPWSLTGSYSTLLLNICVGLSYLTLPIHICKMEFYKYPSSQGFTKVCEIGAWRIIGIWSLSIFSLLSSLIHSVAMIMLLLKITFLPREH